MAWSPSVIYHAEMEGRVVKQWFVMGSACRFMALVGLLCLALLLSGCQGFDVSTLVDQPAPTQTPSAEASGDAALTDGTPTA